MTSHSCGNGGERTAVTGMTAGIGRCQPGLDAARNHTRPRFLRLVQRRAQNVTGIGLGAFRSRDPGAYCTTGQGK